MPKFYVVSDIHGFADEMIEALDEAGFDTNDEDSWLISLGDVLDRGPQSQEVIDYLMGLPRSILLKGNHEVLMQELIEREFPYSYDWHNGTAQSVIDLASDANTFENATIVANNKLKPLQLILLAVALLFDLIGLFMIPSAILVPKYWFIIIGSFLFWLCVRISTIYYTYSLTYMYYKEHLIIKKTYYRKEYSL